MTEAPVPGGDGPRSPIVVPRWEWRTFGQAFGETDLRLAALEPESVEESDEIYLLSISSDASVKVRDGLMDVKQLQAVNESGLEQWKPILKAAFPLDAADTLVVLGALGIEAPPLERGEYTFEQLVAEVIEPSPDLLAVGVHKQRRHHLVGGCLAELSDVRTEEGATRTIAVESESEELVSAAVRELGLGERRNLCVARGLKALVGFGGKRFAVIDVGTNSLKFHIGERQADGEWTTIVDRAEVTRLGEGLDETGELGPGPIERTAAMIAGMVDEAGRIGVEGIAVVGTAGLRIAANSVVLLDTVRDRTGIDVEVISGEEESRLAYLAATSELGVGHGTLVVFDTGGGSSQFTFGAGGHVEERFSVNVGAARFTERFKLDGAVSDNTLISALEAIAIELSRLDGRPTPETLIGMGGAITNLTAVRHRLATYDSAVVQGAVLELAEVDRQLELYRTRSADERRQIVGLQPKRAEVILAGACIVRTVLAKLGRESLTVSDRGLRHGLLLERFGEESSAQPGMIELE